MNSNGRIPFVVILRRDELGLGFSTICGVKGVITLDPLGCCVGLSHRLVLFWDLAVLRRTVIVWLILIEGSEWDGIPAELKIEHLGHLLLIVESVAKK
ncbi:hypothetical protein OUZ56_013384 [Daphnia magna]|uniref:Uncharacterized protein n=1 Tax=Daphnia magna TaxID=35525 RepID=A0ABQ9Z5Q7_9CRUS|nr:hypothetical protein OUZ56_013384 [Daphnia magna]